MIISRADREHFTNGECHSLAVYLHRRGGFPLAVTGDDEHAFVVVAPHTALDVNGVQAIRAITGEWGGGRHHRVSEGYFARMGWSQVRITRRVERVGEVLLGSLSTDGLE